MLSCGSLTYVVLLYVVWLDVVVRPQTDSFKQSHQYTEELAFGSLDHLFTKQMASRFWRERTAELRHRMRRKRSRTTPVWRSTVEWLRIFGNGVVRRATIHWK